MSYEKLIECLTDKHGLIKPDDNIRLNKVQQTLLSPEDIDLNNIKRAAVLIIIYKKNQRPYLCLIRRNKYLGVHSRQISFPGGKQEDTDRDLQETAIRETHEEIGVKIIRDRIIRKLPLVYIKPSNFLVTPFISYAPFSLEFKINSFEVKYIIEAPIDEIFAENNFIEDAFVNRKNEKPKKVSAYKFNNEFIWGATAAMIYEIQQLLKMNS